MTSASTDLTIYSATCHALSKTIGRWCPLLATDVFALKDVGMFCDERTLYHYGNHPVKWVRLTGVIVAVDDYTTRRVYILDDSSGVCIECTAMVPKSPPTTLSTNTAMPPSRTTSNHKGKEPAEATDSGAKPAPSVQEPAVPWDDIDVGSVIKLKGKVGEFRGIRQIDVIKIEIIRSTDAEVKCWNEVLTFRRDVLSVPWVVTKEGEEECRRKMEKEERRQRRKNETKDERRRRKEREERARAKQTETNPPPKAEKRRVKYPSLAVIKASAGKYDALGI